MGIFSSIFGGGSKGAGTIHSGKNSQWAYANRFNQARGGHAGGYAAITFGNIMSAHCSEDDIIEEFYLDQEDCSYKHPYLGMTCWMKAYQEALQEAQAEAMAMQMMGVDVDPEDLIDWAQVEDDAYDYAVDLANLYISGQIWIPGEILDWAYYDISDHNW